MITCIICCWLVKEIKESKITFKMFMNNSQDLIFRAPRSPNQTLGTQHTTQKIRSMFLFCPAEHLAAAAQGATHLPREGAQGARTNSRAVGPRSARAAGLRCGAQGAPHLRGSGTLPPAARCPGMPNPRHGLLAPHPVRPPASGSGNTTARGL